ncbi:MAG: excinuclease ABC subunit UvrA, partial [Chitinophagales bacterium]
MQPNLPAISEAEIEEINVYGARVHNLQDIEVHIPRNQMVVITGISGSGKSSLAFDTIYAEGQRRYMESFSAYARQFVGSMERPDVDKITGLSPVISIEQKTTNRNPRSTVGTITEIYDFLRLLFARVGEAYSYNTGKKMVRYTEQQILEYIFKNYADKKILLLAPLVKGRKGHYRELFEQVQKQGYLKVRIDGEIKDIVPKMQVDRYKIHDIELVIDRTKVAEKFKDRIRASLATALKMGKGLMMIMEHGKEEVQSLSKLLMCADTGLAYDEPSPNTFSFNSPYGACTTCKGLGYVNDVDLDLVIPDKSLSISKEAIKPLGKPKKSYTFKKLKSIAQSYDFTFKTPIDKVEESALNVVLYGSEKPLKIKVGEGEYYDLEYEGVVNTIKRTFKDKNASEPLRRWAGGFMVKKQCPSCEGQRLRKESVHFKIDERNIADLVNMDISLLRQWFENLEERLNDRQKVIAKDILKEIRARIGFLLDVGLDYLTLNRPTRTLSGGESQRIRLATQIGSKLVGITYILDEPSIGLHQRDNERLINALKELTTSGNTVLVVEHDKDIMMAAH